MTESRWPNEYDRNLWTFFFYTRFQTIFNYPPLVAGMLTDGKKG